MRSAPASDGLPGHDHRRKLPKVTRVDRGATPDAHHQRSPARRQHARIIDVHNIEGLAPGRSEKGLMSRCRYQLGIGDDLLPWRQPFRRITGGREVGPHRLPGVWVCSRGTNLLRDRRA
jgi:hypothetical protein